MIAADKNTAAPTAAAAADKAPVVVEKPSLGFFKRIPMVAYAVAVALAAVHYAPAVQDKISNAIAEFKQPAGLDAKLSMELFEMMAEEIDMLRDELKVTESRLLDVITADESVPEPVRLYDFKEEFDVNPIVEMHVDPDVVSALESYELTEDPLYLENADHYDALAEEFGAELEDPVTDYLAFHVEEDEEEGAVLHASVDFAAGEYLGHYAGVITDKKADTTYMWKYGGDVHDKDGKLLDLNIDGREYANEFRFLGVAEADEGNVEALYVPYNNVWYVVFVATRDIEAGEPLLLSQQDLDEDQAAYEERMQGLFDAIADTADDDDADELDEVVDDDADNSAADKAEAHDEF